MVRYNWLVNEKSKKNLQQFGLILLIITLGTAIDWVVHHTSSNFSVPFEYYPNKIIFGAFWGFVSFKVLRHWFKTPFSIAAGICAVVSIVLQTKYFLQGYDIRFVILFMFLHFGMFILPAIPIFKRHWHVFYPNLNNGREFENEQLKR